MVEFTIEDTNLMVPTDDGSQTVMVRTGGYQDEYWVEFCPDTRLAEIIKNHYRSGDVIIADDFFEHNNDAAWEGRHVIFMTANEHNKTMDTVIHLISMLPTTFSKSNRLLIIGGGITQDVGGFLAAIFKRGIPYILIPTTLLAMTDSCIGSKVCLNLGSKNRLGLFNPPTGVVLSGCELGTLPDEMIRSGLGESLKLALIGGWGAWDEFCWLLKEWRLMDIVRQSLLIKKAVIEKDEFEKHERKALNYGHTIGHAIEACTGFEIPHGIAVLLGIIHVNALFEVPWTSRVHPIIMQMIPEAYQNRTFDIDELMRHLSQDKKNRGDQVGFVVLDEPGRCSFRWLPMDQLRQRLQGQIV